MRLSGKYLQYILLPSLSKPNIMVGTLVIDTLLISIGSEKL